MNWTIFSALNCILTLMFPSKVVHSLRRFFFFLLQVYRNYLAVIQQFYYIVFLFINSLTQQ